MTKAVKKVHEQEIDAVALVRHIRDLQAEQIAGMTAEQQIAFYQAKAQDLLWTLRAFQPAKPAERTSPVSDSH
jgi:hypothetical protein